MLEPEALAVLKGRRNLLAFSAGVDSTALFFLLKEAGITCDLALVNYQTRPQSDEEAAYARLLGTRHGVRTFVHTAPLLPHAPDFEAKARAIRYDFFHRLIRQEGYDNLITAHQLDDQLTWSLMQITKGAGLAELIGMAPVQKRPGYTLVRPLLFTPKSALLAYLKRQNIRYFEDSSNQNPRHARNRFRQACSDFLLAQNAEGIARSFRYLLYDKARLGIDCDPLFETKDLTVLPAHEDEGVNLRRIDRELKKRGYVAGAAQKAELARQKAGVVGGRWAVAMQPERLWIAPYRRAVMPKSFKERCRKAKVPPVVRGYLFEALASEELEALFSPLSS